ncbi:hypothetical protein ABZ915_00725 [Streptomyces sp. NPDC046915]|uniref:hypothetical protein n=1 Tax=Streptomyces sp. NPDC046915 TaxID=3155257 RepID=UPI00340B9074
MTDVKWNPRMAAATARARGVRRGFMVAATIGGMLLASGCRTGGAAADAEQPGDGGLRATGVALTAVPSSLSAVKCRTAVPESYLAVVSFAKGHKGGEITLRYGATGSTMKEETLSVPAGRTSVTKSFFHSEYIVGNSLAAAQVNVVKPNLVQSATVHPTGMCSDSGLWDTGTDAGTTGGF